MEYGYLCLRPGMPFEPFCQGKIFVDQAAELKRPAFDQLTNTVGQKDKVVLPTLSCLGNTFSQILSRWNLLKEKGVQIEVIDCMEQADSFMAYLEKMREQMKECQIKTERNCSKPGARPKEIPEEFEALSQFYRQGRISSRDAADRLNVSHTTFLRWCRTRTAQ